MGIFATGYIMAEPSEIRAERMQGHVRIPAAILMSIYAVTASLLITEGRYIEAWAINLLASYLVYAVAAIVLLILIARFPGNYPVRRIFAMLCDYCAAGFSIIAGCTVMLPAYVFIVWIALGNGLRYGRLYLILASAMAQLCLLTVFLATPHWQADPVLAATLSITALVVPAFAYSLLRAKENAERATREAVKARSRFLAQASHDLRQPIHAMSLFLNGLKQTPMTAEQNQLVVRLDRSLDSVAALFRSLLDISSIDGGALKPNLTAVPVQRIFDDLKQQGFTAPDGSYPRICFVPTKRWVRTDTTLLTTMLQNLLANAARYASGSDILVGCRRIGGRVSIGVIDQGPGIAAHHLPHLFEEFYQIRDDVKQNRGGVGLGLAIVQRLCDILDIRPEIRSVEGRGTSVWLHGIEEVAPAHLPQSAERRLAFARAPLQDMRVLLVEDDKEVLNMTADLLRSWGCQIEAFGHFPENPEPCDLIITDFDIGQGKTGMDVIEKGSEASGIDVPAIIVTGHDKGALPDSLNGPNRYVMQKPIKPADLRSAISTIRLNLLG